MVITFRSKPLYKSTVQVDSPVNPMEISSGFDNKYLQYIESKQHKENEMILLNSDDFRDVVMVKLEGDGHVIDKKDVSVQVTGVDETNVLKIAVAYTDAMLCKTIADAYADEYVKRAIDRYKSGKQRLSKEMEINMLPKLEARLDALKKEKVEFLNSLGIADVSGVKEIRNATMTKWNNLITKSSGIEQQVISYKMMRDYLSREFIGECDYVKIGVLFGDSEDKKIGSLVKEREDLLVKTGELISRYKDKWPEVIQTKERISLIESEISSGVKKHVEALNHKIAMLDAEHKSILSLIAGTETELADTNRKLVKLDTINSDIDAVYKQYDYYQRLAAESGILQYVNLPKVRVLERAILPSKPFKPNIGLNIVIGLVASLTLGIVLSFLMDIYQGIVRDPSELEMLFSTNLIGMIPTFITQSKSLVVDEEEYAFYESLKRTSTEVKTILKNTGKKVFSVLSANPKEGKTTFVINIAKTLSKDGYSVLLIEGDLRRPNLHNIAYNKRSRFELYLSGETGVDSVVHQSYIENVHVIPCFDSFADSFEILNSEQYEYLVDYGKQNYDIVIIDSPPLLHLADGGIIAKYSDASLLVARDRKVRLNDMRSVHKMMSNLGIQLAGIILNDVSKQSISHSCYNYSYYYGISSSYYYKTGQKLARSGSY